MTPMDKSSKVGISSVGVYIPKFRLDQEILESAWDTPYPKSEISVMGHDEDTLTMAVEATFSCLNEDENNENDIGGLFFSSVSAPFAEKLQSAFISLITGLGEDIRTADFSGSIRSGTIALNSAIDQVSTDSTRSALVVASDSRLAEPNGDQELLFGSAAVSLMISSKNPMVTIEDRLSIADQLGLFWRRNNELFPHSEDPRFFNQYGYLAMMERGISNLFSRNKISGKGIKRAILSSPDHRSYRNVAKRVGIDEANLQQPQFDSLGDTGSPHPLLLLSSALEELDPGDLILLAHYGEGVDVFLFQATEYISGWKNLSAISRKISDTPTIPLVYGKHLLWRNLIKRSPEKIHPFTSTIHTWRESRQLFQLIGCKCPNCGTVNYPVRKICFNCENSEGLEEIKLSRKGTIASFTHDYVYITPDPPLTMALVDLESGGRILLQMTDKPKMEKVQIETPVELTFRKLMEGDDFLNYFWKCKIRG